MKQYNYDPNIAVQDTAAGTEWIMPDGAYRVLRHKDLAQQDGQYEILERRIRNDSKPATLYWKTLGAGLSKRDAQETLQITLYPVGSEPSPEDHRKRQPARQHDAELSEMTGYSERAQLDARVGLAGNDDE